MVLVNLKIIYLELVQKTVFWAALFFTLQRAHVASASFFRAFSAFPQCRDDKASVSGTRTELWVLKFEVFEIESLMF